MTEYMKNFTADDMPKKADAPKSEVKEEKKAPAPKQAPAAKTEPAATEGGQTGDDVETHGVGPSTVEGQAVEEEK